MATPIPVPAGMFAAVEARGVFALVQFTAGLVLFLALYAVRAPLLFAARVLTVAMCRTDMYVSDLTATTNPMTATTGEEPSRAETV